MISIRLKNTALFLLLLNNACRVHDQAGEADSYVEQGKEWAYGSVQLTDTEGPAVLMLSLTTTNGTNSYKLYGAIQAQVTGGSTTSASSGVRDLTYVDYHPQADKALAYAFEWDFRPRANSQDKVVDTYVLLRKAGRSFNTRSVFIGTARFETGAQTAKLAPYSSLRISSIIGGINAGQWALHYADVAKVTVNTYSGDCPKFIRKAAGQVQDPNAGVDIAAVGTATGSSSASSSSSSSSVTSSATSSAAGNPCKPQPAAVDLCDGDPSQCQPSSLPSKLQAGFAVDGLDAVSGKTGVYTLPATTKDAKLIFTSASLKAGTREENADLCERKFNAMARTVAQQMNPRCVLKPAPAEPIGGQLACGVTIGFDQAETYLERICQVLVTFKSSPADTQMVQVLKR